MQKPHGGKLVKRVLPDDKKKTLLENIDSFPSIEVSKDLAKDIENISTGVFSPLEGFMCENDFNSVLGRMRLVDDTPWTIPMVFDVTDDFAKKIDKGTDISIYYDGNPLAILHVEQKYQYDKGKYAEKVFGTSNTKHPGVSKVNSMGNYLLGGTIDLINRTPKDYYQYSLTPIETRILFEERGWKSIVAFQTRNAPHIGHEYVQKSALTFVDAIFINPLIGKKKKGDFKDEVILKTYEVLIDMYYLKHNSLLAVLETEMRYGGPREAIFHSIMRKNFGCTHFIVGRDHAGVGDFYPPYAAQEIFDDFPDLGITPLFFKSFSYCKKCGSVVNDKICPHPMEDHIMFSGTKIRNLLIAGERPSDMLVRPEVTDIILQYKNSFVE
ncbi:sulfate adenylyltransferase [bacterium]|nr:sulfate adenylyltransferase [bacterium]